MLLCAAVLMALWWNAKFEAPIVIACCAVALHIKALEQSIVHSGKLFWTDLGEALLGGTGIGMMLLAAFPVLGSGTTAALAGLSAAAVLPIALRPLVRHLTANKTLVESTLIVGNGRLAEKLHQALVSVHSASGHKREEGVLRFPGASAASGGVTYFEQLSDILRRERVSRVIVAEQDAENRSRLAAILAAPRLNGLRVNDAIDFYEQHFRKIWIEALNWEWFLYTGGFRKSRAGAFVKRALDIVFALLLLVLTAPLLLLVALAIRIDSKGPVFFRQVRVGQRGKTFVIYKFRSMRVDAESQAGPAWAKEFDERTTRVGRFLRRCHLDEIPQAINVLRGEMSMVGPRPERPYFVDRLSEDFPFYSLRHSVKPGITGLAQVKYRYGASVEDAGEKLQYDLYYAKHGSLVEDIGILLNTVEIVLFGVGR